MNRSGPVGPGRTMTTAWAEALGRLAFVPASACRFATKGLATILRMRAFFIRLAMSLQMAGFSRMLGALVAFRKSRAAGEGRPCATVLAVGFAWDETKQLLRDPAPGPLARQSSAKVARNILVQRCIAHAAALGEDGMGRPVELSKAEELVVPPLELHGKSVPFLATGIGRAAPFSLFDASAVRQVADHVSAVVLGFAMDAARTNRRLLKHIVGKGAVDGWPSNVVIDPNQLCLLHQLHRIKVQLVDVHSVVSLLYCLSRLVRAGSVVHVVADFISRFVEQHCQRRLGAPPAEAVERSRRAMDLLYGLDAAHHRRATQKGDSESRLLRDVKEVLRLDNGGMADRGAGLVHFCAGADGSPCCADLRETKERMTAAYLNLFTCHAMPTATLSRWTHVEIVCSMLCCGYICRDLYLNALLEGLAADDRAQEVVAQTVVLAASGAGDEDVVTEHRARIAKVRQWLGLPQTREHLGCLFLMLRNLSSISYFLMSHELVDRAGDIVVGPVGSVRPMRELLGRVRSSLSAFATGLRDFVEPASESHFLLQCVGVSGSDLGGERLARILRRYFVGASVGVFRRLARRLEAFPMRLWVVADPSTTPEQRLRCAQAFVSQPDCCVGVCGQGIRRLCPTAESLLAPVGQALIKTWLKSVQWSIHSCEKQHASCRRLCAGSGPAKNWTLVARERVAESLRAVHLRRTGVDPALCDEVPTRGKKRSARAVSPERHEAIEAATLQCDAPALPSAILPWSEQAAERQVLLDEEVGAGRPSPEDAALLAAMGLGGGAQTHGRQASRQVLGLEAPRTVCFGVVCVCERGRALDKKRLRSFMFMFLCKYVCVSM